MTYKIIYGYKFDTNVLINICKDAFEWKNETQANSEWLFQTRKAFEMEGINVTFEVIDSADFIFIGIVLNEFNGSEPVLIEKLCDVSTIADENKIKELERIREVLDFDYEMDPDTYLF